MGYRATGNFRSSISLPLMALEFKTSVSKEEGAIIAIVGVFALVALSQLPPAPVKEVVTSENGYYAELMEEFKLTSLKTSCGGIERYYSGEGFQQDLLRLTRDYNEIYDPEEGNPLGRNLTLIAPRGISIGAPGFDCEDMAHATMCLGSLYPDVFCKPVLKSADHIEAECYKASWVDG